MTELEKASKSLRQKFKQSILERGYTQRELAKMIDVSENQLSRAIAGNVTPRDIAIQKELAKILGIEI